MIKEVLTRISELNALKLPIMAYVYYPYLTTPPWTNQTLWYNQVFV